MTHDQMSEQCTRRPDGAYLIQSAPQFRQYAAAKAAREIVGRITAPLTAFVAGYRAELEHALDASAIYLGPGK